MWRGQARRSHAGSMLAHALIKQTRYGVGGRRTAKTRTIRVHPTVPACWEGCVVRLACARHAARLSAFETFRLWSAQVRGGTSVRTSWPKTLLPLTQEHRRLLRQPAP